MSGRTVLRRPRVWSLLLAGVLAVVAGCAADAGVVEVGSWSNETSGDPTGDDADGDATTGDDPMGDDADGDATTGDDVDDDAADDADGDATTGDDVDDDVDGVAPFDPDPIEWRESGDRVDVATVEVPVDYADPDGEQIELHVARYRALDPDRRIGSLLVNPGGPGFGGSDLAYFAPQIFDREIIERFDIVGWDPRGTGLSEPAIDCIDDYDPFFTAIDSTPETEAEHDALVELAEEFARRCVGGNPGVITQVGTNNSARDMDSLRRALGEDQISYFGFSYGSELGGTWATLFPDTVRAAVLDGAADPNADALESSLQQMAGFEASVATFLARCSDDPRCDFHNDGDAEGAFDELMEDLDDDPVPADDDRPPVNRDVATTAVIQSMYSENSWPQLERALADAQDGDGTGLLALHDSYYQRQYDGTYGNELEAFQAISCADVVERLTVEEIDAQVARFHEVAPRLAPADSAGGYFCTFFPPALDPRVEITGAGAGPVVVIGTTGDPATPLESTRRMAEALEDGRLVVVEADQHTGYGLNDCVVDVVNDYLIDLESPDDGTECR